MQDSTQAEAGTMMRAWFRRVWNEKDPSAIEELLAPDGRVHGLGPDVATGPAGFRPFWDAIQESFDEIRIDVVDSVDDGNRTWVRCRAEAVVKGNSVIFEGGCQATVENGLIQEAWNYWDFVGCMHQMGALPADAFAQACAGNCWI